MTKSQKTRFNELMACEFKTGVAWVMKNIFRDFWNCSSELRGELFFTYWCELVDKTKLKPLIKVKDMMERHKGNIINYCAL